MRLLIFIEYKAHSHWCEFRNGLHQHRDRKFSFSAGQHNHDLNRFLVLFQKSMDQSHETQWAVNSAMDKCINWDKSQTFTVVSPLWNSRMASTAKSVSSEWTSISGNCLHKKHFKATGRMLAILDHRHRPDHKLQLSPDRYCFSTTLRKSRVSANNALSIFPTWVCYDQNR